jgi:aspartate carbamoyltransferase catalytic subunit
MVEFSLVELLYMMMKIYLFLKIQKEKNSTIREEGKEKQKLRMKIEERRKIKRKQSTYHPAR